MKKLLTLLMICSLILLTGCGGKKISDTCNDSNKIVIGVDDDFAPICFHDEHNVLVGFDVDLAKEAAKRMNVEIEFKPIDWDKKRDEITSGNIDVIWNGLDITEERKEYLIFTKPYMDDRQILLVKKGNDQGIYSEEDLAGKIVGTQADSTSDDYINQNEHLKNSLKGYKTCVKFLDVLEVLKNDEIDVLICDELIARYEMNKHPGLFEILNVRIGSVAEMAVGFHKDNIKLRDRVQKVFDEMIKDGTAREISEKWFRADVIRHR